MAGESRPIGSGEVLEFPKGKVELVTLGGRTIARGTYEPGWHWAEHLGPVQGTDSCQHHHTGYVISGRLRVRLDDGSEVEAGAGDVYDVPPGHDGWVVGDEPYVFIDLRAESMAKDKA